MKKLCNIFLVLAIIGTICMRFAYAPEKSTNNLFVDDVVAAMLDWQPCIVNKDGEVIARLDPPDPEAPYPSSIADFNSDGVAMYSTDFYWLPSEFPAFKYGLVNTNGEFVLQPDFDYISDFQNGMAVVSKNEEYGIVNAEGEFVIEICFDGLKSFENDKYTPAKQGEKWGYINKKGDFVIAPQFDDARSFAGKEYARVKIDGRSELIDRKGNLVSKITSESIHGIYGDFTIVNDIEVKKSGRRIPHYSLLNIKTGETTSLPYENIGEFDENGLAPVCKFSKWGYINTKGEEVIKCQFREAGEFTNGIAPVIMRDKSCAYIDENGKIVMQFEDFTKLGSFHNGLAWFADKNDKVGYINEKGEIVIEPQFELYANVIRQDIFKQESFYAGGNFYDDGYAVVETSNYKQGVIDMNGNYVLEPIYDWIG